MKLAVGAKNEAEKLRRFAEQRISGNLDGLIGDELDEKRLLHELQVYKIELELQVEALSEARTLAEESLALAVRVQESYVELFDFAPMAYFTIGRDGVILSLNFRAEQLLGLARSRVSGKVFSDSILPEFRPIFSRFLANVFSGGDQRCELCLLNSGGRRWVSIEAAADFSGQTCLAALLDITEQKRSQQDAELAATIYRALPEAIIVTDSDNQIISINPAFTRLTGYTEQETIGKTAKLLKSDRHDADFYSSMWDSLNSTGLWAGEIWNRRKNGNVCAEWLSISTVYDDQGEVKMRVGMLFDLSGKHG